MNLNCFHSNADFDGIEVGIRFQGSPQVSNSEDRLKKVKLKTNHKARIKRTWHIKLFLFRNPAVQWIYNSYRHLTPSFQLEASSSYLVSSFIERNTKEMMRQTHFSNSCFLLDVFFLSDTSDEFLYEPRICKRKLAMIYTIYFSEER